MKQLAGAMYIADRLPENAFINMGYGDTPSRILNHLCHPHRIADFGGVADRRRELLPAKRTVKRVQRKAVPHPGPFAGLLKRDE